VWGGWAGRRGAGGGRGMTLHIRDALISVCGGALACLSPPLARARHPQQPLSAGTNFGLASALRRPPRV
jgi:hypothetical protein